MSDKISKIPSKAPYKDKMNRFFTVGLFADALTCPDRESAPFTLLADKPGKVSVRRTFVEMNDPTGYKWAMKYLDSYQHWENLMKLDWFKEAYNVWMRELHAKMRSDAILKIQHIANDEETSDSQRLAASKYLAERPYEQADLNKAEKKRGRPSKAEVRGELKKAVKMDAETAAEFERVGLKLVEGGKKSNG